MEEALQKLIDLEKASEEGIFKKLVQFDDMFVMTVGEKQYQGKRTITHYLRNGGLEYITIEFRSEGYAYVEVQLPKNNPEYLEEQLIYEKFK